MRRLGRGALFGVYTVVATLLLLELALRLFLPQGLMRDAEEVWTPDPTIGWRRRPNIRAVLNRGEGNIDFCTDSLGDRISCQTGPPPGCKKRVLIIGDSSVEAVAVPYEKTVWSLLERATGACVQVAGVGGYNPAQYLQLGKERLAGGSHFDLVILNLYLGNDFGPGAGRIPSPEEAARKPFRLLPENFTLKGLFKWLYPLNQFLESRSHAWAAAKNPLRRLYYRNWFWPALLRSNYSEGTIEAWLRPIQELVDESVQHGTRVLIVLIPVYVQVLDPTGEDSRRQHPELAEDIDMNTGSERVLPLLRNLEARIVDLLPGFRVHSDRHLWGKYDLHFSSQGQELWFQLIKEDVFSLLEAGSSGGTTNGHGRL